MIKFTLTLIALSVLFSGNTHARNDKLKLPIKDAMSAVAAKKKLGGDVKFFFGSKNKLKIKKNFGEFTSNKKTYALNETDKEACEWAFLSAMLSFQDRARSLGGNAVINIKSFYYKNTIDSSKVYECGAGAVVSGVTFTGDVVILK